MAQYTIEQYNALKEAIALGALMVVYGNKTVTYRSLDDMLKIKKMMEEDLGIVDNASSNRRFGSFSKGIL
ncbi:MAG: phage head-tail joining protein [Bacteroidia bacterium]